MATVQDINFDVNLWRSILWQHEGAPKALALCEHDQFFADTHVKKFWNDFIDDIYNLKTANTFGLYIWARILGSSISISMGAPKDNWGFGSNDKNFENAGFGYSGSGSVLTIESTRILLLMRWFQLTTAPTVPNINYMLQNVFGAGQAYVVDLYETLPMEMKYFFQGQLPTDLEDVFTNEDVLPRPSGVLCTYSVVPREAFGYGVQHLNYERGSFAK